MKYIILGSNGFIGRNLVKHLKKNEDNFVWEADIKSMGGEMFFRIDSINTDYNNIFITEQFDVCINCSGSASVQDSLCDPLYDYTLNTVNVFKILDAIRKYQPLCKFINLSSAAVYGNPQILPIREDAKLQPLSPYGIHKMQSEEICQLFYNLFHIATCSLRVFSAYGEGLKKQLFWDLSKKVETEQTVRLFGTGGESRDFIYIFDLVNAIEIVSKNGSFVGESINVANGEEVLIADCVELFLSNFGSHIQYEFAGDLRQGDPNNWVADIATLKSLGYTKNFSLKEGLKNYYKWVIEIEKE